MKAYLRTAVLLIAIMALMSGQASALSIRQFESKTRDQRAEFLVQAVNKIVADVAPVNPALSRAIHDYFDVTPPGSVGAPGKIAFEGALAAVEDAADQGTLDLDKVQIERILLDIVKTDVMSKQGAKNNPPPAQK